MASCEKCWEDAFVEGQGTDLEKYRKLLAERADNPCTAKEQAGQFWSEEHQADLRTVRISLGLDFEKDFSE